MLPKADAKVEYEGKEKLYQQWLKETTTALARSATVAYTSKPSGWQWSMASSTSSKDAGGTAPAQLRLTDALQSLDYCIWLHQGFETSPTAVITVCVCCCNAMIMINTMLLIVWYWCICCVHIYYVCIGVLLLYEVPVMFNVN